MKYRLLNYSPAIEAPQRIVRAVGSTLTDRSGRELIDFGLGAGSQILGHASEVVVEAMARQAKLGNVYIEESEQIHELCDLLSRSLPSEISNFVFCNSGTEATYRALRYARIASGRSRVACFSGSWHGMNEWVMTDGGGRFLDRAPHLLDGVPQIVASDSIRLPFNDRTAFDILDEYAGSVAAVILEPIFGSVPRLAEDFISELVVFCRDRGILIIFDEIITGFRLALGGAAEKLKLRPDIATYGKILGGGLPIGLVGMTEETLERITGRGGKVVAGGTFSANPLVAHVATAVLSELRKMPYSSIEAAGDSFRRALNGKLASAGIDMGVIGHSSISRLSFTSSFYKDRAQREELECSVTEQKKFKAALRDRGYVWPGSGLIFNSFCHSSHDVEQFVDAIFSAASEVFGK